MTRTIALEQIEKSFSNLSNVYMYLTKDDLFLMLKEQRRKAIDNERQLRETSEYLDRLLCKVMNSNPSLLHNMSLSTNIRHNKPFSYRR